MSNEQTSNKWKHFSAILMIVIIGLSFMVYLENLEDRKAEKKQQELEKEQNYTRAGYLLAGKDIIKIASKCEAVTVADYDLNISIELIAIGCLEKVKDTN